MDEEREGRSRRAQVAGGGGSAPSIEVVQFELAEEGILALLNTIGSNVTGGPGGDVDPRWRPIVTRLHYTRADVTLTPSIERLDALVREIKARDGRTGRRRPAPRAGP